MNTNNRNNIQIIMEIVYRYIDIQIMNQKNILVLVESGR